MPWLLLAGLSLIGLPLFLCMPLWPDLTLYDVCARSVLSGGIHYRDVFDTNLPGAVWLHVAIRSMLGWSSGAIRGVDLGVIAVIIALLTTWLPRVCGPSRGWLALIVALFYLSTSEWCHGQRDVWMLVPALLALHARRLLHERWQDPGCERGCWYLAVLEGVLWGAAVWIKPHALLPAFATFTVSAGFRLRRGVCPPGTVALDLVCVIGGGLLAGLAGAAWLVRSGSWPYMWSVLLDWNREYDSGKDGLVWRAILLLVWFRPWGWCQLVAVPWAIGVVVRGVAHSAKNTADDAMLPCAFYLGWILQAGFVQRAYGYVHASAMLLALGVLGAVVWPRCTAVLRLLLVTCLMGFALPAHPLLAPERLSWWGRCMGEGSTPAARDALAMEILTETPTWTDLARVAEFLRTQGLKDRELTCFHNSTHPLYLELGLEPSAPFLHWGTFLGAFRSKREFMRRQLEQSPQKLVVSDLFAVGFKLSDLARAADRDAPRLPADFPARWAKYFPWTEPIVFRSGRYVIHRVTGPVRELWQDPPGDDHDPAKDQERPDREAKRR